MSLERKEIFEFGGFRLDVNEHTIERIDGIRNGSITEKAFQALVLLVRRRGHLVSRDELINFIWPDTIVEDNNLEKCVHQLRHFLGETANGHKYIETVRKHGYRFVETVEVVEVSSSWLPETFRTDNGKNGSTDSNGHHLTQPESEPETTDEAGAASAGKVRHPFRRAAVLSVIILALIGGMAGLGYYLFIRPGVGADGRKSIAVLPFRPINTSNRDEIYEIGLAESVIHQLRPINGLVVRPLSAMRAYTEVGQDPVAAGREQKVDHILSSNYQLSDGKFRITADLINVASGQIEDSYKVETPAGDAFTVQDFIAAEIGKKIVARFGTTIGTASKRGTSNEGAYRHYLQGMTLYDQRKGQEAVEHFDRAVALTRSELRACLGGESTWSPGDSHKKRFRYALGIRTVDGSG